MKTIIRFIMLTLFVVLMFGMSANAEVRTYEEDVVGDFMSVFDLTFEDLSYETPSAISYNYIDYYIDIESNIDSNIYGDFTFSGGLERLRFSAFSCEKNIVGYGVEGTTVGLLVYEVTNDGMEVLDYKLRELGASGLYSDTITFGYNRVQYLAVAVREGDYVYTNVYEVTTKELATKDLLENLEINFIADDEEPEAVPEFDFPVMTDLEF